MNNLIDRIQFGPECYAPDETGELALASAGYIMEDMQDIGKSYVRLGFHLNEMETFRYYEDLGYTDFYECVQKNFHMDKSAVSRCIAVWKEFSAFDDVAGSRKMWLDERYADYSYSQLVEMLPLKPEQRRRVRSDMTVAQIREFKRQLKKPSNAETKADAKAKIVATSHLQKEVSDNKECSCPPNARDCMRQEWGTKEEEQKRGREECKKCWKRYNEERKMVVAAEEEAPVHRPEFPDMKNMQEREDFVDAYKSWNIWCRNDLTEEVFYRYDLPDGAAIVVKNYPCYLGWKKEDREERDLYLLKSGYKHFADCKSNMTQIKEYLKNLRKKG